MKKKAAITVCALLLLAVGGVTALNVINPSWTENTIFATARDKQLAYLKAHEKENYSVDSLKVSEGRNRPV